MSGFRLRLNAAREVEKVCKGSGMVVVASDIERATKVSAVANRSTDF